MEEVSVPLADKGPQGLLYKGGTQCGRSSGHLLQEGWFAGAAPCRNSCEALVSINISPVSYWGPFLGGVFSPSGFTDVSA